MLFLAFLFCAPPVKERDETDQHVHDNNFRCKWEDGGS